MASHRPRYDASQKRGRARPAWRPRRLASEMLESRMMLAQTTGLFFNNAGSQDGYVLFSPNTTTATYLIDKGGNVVNQWNSQYVPGLLSYLLPNGNLLRDDAPHGQGGNGSINAAGAGGLLTEYDWNGNTVWQFAYDSPTHLAHHDFQVLPNGNVLLIAWELKSQAEATAAGRNPGLSGPGYLYPDSIVEVQPDFAHGTGSVVWQWQIWDHLVQDFDATKSNYYGPTGVQDHPELINLNYSAAGTDGGGAPEDWTHCNGIDYNPQLDQIVLSSREFSEFWIIDHSTTTAQAASHSGGRSGHGGDVLYRYGNPQTYGRGTAADRVFYYQHDPKWIPDGMPGAGNITVFNNGVGRPGDPDYSSVDEITPPAVDSNGNYALTAGQAYGPTALTWVYQAPTDYFSAIISGATRLPNGNTLIDYGVNATFSEVTPAGQEVWKYVSPYTGGGTLGPTTPIPSLGLPPPLLNSLRANFTFQAIYYPTDYLTTGGSIAGRHIFYNQSGWDGGSAAIDFASDNSAIAPDKTAYLPGDPKAVAVNITNYSRGINGIMIDLAGGGLHLSISASDFVFKVGNDNTPASWAAAPSPASIAVSLGGGVGGSDRVEITWANGNIANKWLEVQVLPTSHTGLASADVFFWGNKIGDSASGTLNASNFITNTTDAAQVNATLTQGGATITDLRDYNRDKSVNTTDAAIVNASLGTLNRLLVGGGPFAPEGGGGDGGGDAGIASALAGGGGGTAQSSSQGLPTGDSPTAVVERADGGGGSIAAVDSALAGAVDDKAQTADDGQSDLDELLDLLAADHHHHQARQP